MAADDSSFGNLALGLGPVVIDFTAVEILLPFYSLRLMTGASMVRFPDARVFVGEDPTYGRLGAVETMSEGLGTQAPTCRMTIQPPTRVAAAALNDPANQESIVRSWYGCCDIDTGELIAIEPLFFGGLNQPRYSSGKAPMSVEYDCASGVEILFSNEEGLRLNHATQTLAFPDDYGLEYGTAVERKLPWGSEAGRPPLVSAAGGGYATQYDNLTASQTPRGGLYPQRGV